MSSRGGSSRSWRRCPAGREGRARPTAARAGPGRCHRRRGVWDGRPDRDGHPVTEPPRSRRSPCARRSCPSPVMRSTASSRTGRWTRGSSITSPRPTSRPWPCSPSRIGGMARSTTTRTGSGTSTATSGGGSSARRRTAEPASSSCTRASAPTRIRQFYTEPEAQTRWIEVLVGLVEDLGLDGINVDVESLPREHVLDYGLFVGRLRVALRERLPNAQVSVATQANDLGRRWPPGPRSPVRTASS